MSTAPLPAAPTAPAARSRRGGGERFGATGWLFALPHFLLFAVFLLAPTIYGFWISLHRWHVLAHTHPFIGLSNYHAALSDDIFYLALRNTIYFVVLVVPAGNAVSLLLALGLSQIRRFRAVYLTAFYLPVVISIAVVAILWQWLYNTEIGLLNMYLKAVIGGLHHLGLPLSYAPIPFLSDPGHVMPSIALFTVWWHAGGNMVLYLAGLGNVPADYYEAAQIDGAGPVTRFWAITWPLLRPPTLFCLVFSVLAAFQIFGQSYVLYGGGSGPGRAGLTLVLYMYQQGFSQYEIGYGTAVAYLLFLMVLVVTLFQFRLLSRREEGPAE